MPDSIALPWENSKDRYDVSVIVPTYNRANYIEECLDSLLNQTHPPMEIIVVDDGSEDDTVDLLRRYGDKIRYVHKENGGRSSAINLGLGLVQGNLIWTFDDDDVALPNAIEHRIAALKDRPDAAFVYSPHYLGMDGPDGRIIKKNLNYLPHYDDESFFAALIKGCFFHLATALVRIEAYRLVGGYDVGLLRSQDYDMQIRLTHAFNVAYSPEPTFIFRQHLGPRGAKEIRHAGKQRNTIFQKYDHQVGLKLRATLSLGDYLVPRTDNVNTVEKTRQALLVRMVVMASKGCIVEMFEDLNAALATLQFGQRLSDSETSLITSSICTGYAYAASQSDWPTFKVCVAQISQHIAGKQTVLALAKGFFRLAKSYPGSKVERTRKLFIAMAMAIGFV